MPRYENGGTLVSDPPLTVAIVPHSTAAWVFAWQEAEGGCYRLIKTPDRISERPPRGGLSDSEASALRLL